MALVTTNLLCLKKNWISLIQFQSFDSITNYYSEQIYICIPLQVFQLEWIEKHIATVVLRHAKINKTRMCKWSVRQMFRLSIECSKLAIWIWGYIFKYVHSKSGNMIPLSHCSPQFVLLSIPKYVAMNL